MSDWLGLYGGHDAGAAYVRDGRLVAAEEEERVTRQKHYIGSPEGSLGDVLALAKVGSGYKIAAASPHLERIERADEVIDHHHAHAAYAYCTSGFERAKVVVVDGGGANAWAGVYDCEPGRLSTITETLMKDGGCPYGQLYGRVTEALGFRTLHDEGKVMGLAAYGDPSVFEGLFDGAYSVSGGRLLCTFPDSDWNATLEIVRANKDPGQREHIAAALQKYFAEMVVEWVGHYITPDDDLCVAGGVFANVKLNQRLLGLCRRLYVAPAMNDGGLAAGAALYAAGLQPVAQHSVFLGYDLGQIEADPRDIAKRLADGNVIALAHGRMEYGPRALGNRSILAHPGIEGIEAELNRRLGRNDFMPFAPVIMAERAGDILESYTGLDSQPSSRHMTLSYDVKPEWRRRLPAVVHIDGTVRPQVIEADGGIYYEILRAFYELTGLPALINTSLNLHNQPVVRTAQEAKATADLAGLELFLGK